MANDQLGSLRIAVPCPASWEGMAGDERLRHCMLCSHLELKAGEVTHASVALRPDTANTITVGGLAPMIDMTASGKTTISRDLPHTPPF